MHSSKRLSVIIPGFNTSKAWWLRCLRSVQSAIGLNDEIVCIDDGSQVRPDFLNVLAEGDARIKVLFLEKNVGQAEARNIGMEACAGEFVAFVDSDDEIGDKTVYEKAIEPLLQNRCDVAVFGVRTIWCAERLYKVDVMQNRDFASIKPQGVKELKDCGLLYYPWNKIFRRAFLDEKNIRFDKKGMPCEDVMFNLECIINGARVSTVNAVGINYYRTWGTSLSCYKVDCISGLMACNNTWQTYKEKFPEAKIVFGADPEFSEDFLLKREWENMWRLHSPCGVRVKLNFLNAHPQFCVVWNPLFLMWQYCYWFMRKWFYITLVRQWHVRRIYPSVSKLAP